MATILASGAIFQIAEEGGLVRCSVENRPNVDPKEGARCAREMGDFLKSQVLTAASPYLGLVFDVQRGPAAFGPKTRRSLEELFYAAEAAQRPLAVRVGPSAIQKLQFTSLCNECAPNQARVFDEPGEDEWIRDMAQPPPTVH